MDIKIQTMKERINDAGELMDVVDEITQMERPEWIGTWKELESDDFYSNFKSNTEVAYLLDKETMVAAFVKASEVKPNEAITIIEDASGKIIHEHFGDLRTI